MMATSARRPTPATRAGCAWAPAIHVRASGLPPRMRACAGTRCLFSCVGENYDVDGSPLTGCEVADTAPGTHTRATARFQGSPSCFDDESAFSISGNIPSDTRVHEMPAPSGFDMTTGSAPDWHRFFGTGGTFCVNDLSVSLAVSGADSPTCFRLIVTTTDFPRGSVLRHLGRRHVHGQPRLWLLRWRLQHLHHRATHLLRGQRGDNLQDHRSPSSRAAVVALHLFPRFGAR